MPPADRRADMIGKFTGRIAALFLCVVTLAAHAQFSIPDKGTAQNDIQSILFKEYLGSLASSEIDFVSSGIAPTAQGSPNMTVALSTGVVFSNGARFAVTGANATITTANATNPRLDLVVITSAGAIAVRAGTAAAAPKPPVKTANDVLIAVVFVPANDTTISSDQIVDLRFIAPELVNERARLPHIVTPAAPATNEIYIYGQNRAGRMLPQWRSPSGVAVAAQPAFFSTSAIWYLPNNGTTIGLNYGVPWVSGGTVSHPTPASTNIVSQMWRTRFANVVTTTNQVLGVGAFAASTQRYWRGNAANLGGFFFHSRFVVELWPAATVRVFVGLSDQTTAVVASDTLAGNLAGLLHITTDAATVLNFTTRDGTTASSTAITLTGALAAGQAFDFFMYCPPNGSTIYFRLDDINAGTTLIDSSKATNLPTATAFMGPQAHMSNGTANTTVTTTAIGIQKIYVESDR